MAPELKKLEKSKVISVRIKGKNLALFNQMNLSPTEFFNYALKKYSEEFISSEKLEVMSQIQSTIVDIHNYELEVASKRNLLDKLRKELLALDSKEYLSKKKELFPLLKEKYHEDIMDGKVDCIESFFKLEKSFIDIKAFELKINQNYLDKIVEDFYNEESRSVEFDNLDVMKSVAYSQ